MPGLDTEIHKEMLAASKSWPRLRMIARALRNKPIYGLEWGDPEQVEPLQFIKQNYVTPYVNSAHTALEIGPGGGRWTRYILGFDKLYLVEYYQELLDEIRGSIKSNNIIYVKNEGTDFPGVPENSIDFLFSFGVFVHLDQDIIAAYLRNMMPILNAGANVVLHYSDKTKIMAQQNEGFSDNTPDEMRAMVKAAGYKVLQEDLTTMWHSSVIRFTKPA